jgi:O-antigen/teichoic acid export membrane protein
MNADTPSPKHQEQLRLRRLRTLLVRARDDSLTRNSVFIMATTVVNSALGAVFWVVAARTFSTREVGLGAALVAAVMLAATLSNLGAGPTLIQILPTRRAGRDWSRTFNACMGAGLGAAALAGCIALFILPLLSPGFSVVRESAYRVAVVGGVVVWTASTILDFAFVAERAAGKMLTRNAAAATLRLALVLCFVALGARSSLSILSAWAGSTAVALLFGAAVLLPGLHRGYRPEARGVATEARRLVPPFVGHYFISVGGMIPMYILPLLVTALLSATANAYFYTTWMLCSVFFMVSPAVAAALFAEGSHTEGSMHQKARSSAVIIAALLSVPMVVLLLGGRFVLALFGLGYAQHSYVLLVLLVVSAVPDAMTNVYVSVLRVEQRFRAAAALNIGMGLGVLALAWWLLPLVGVAGAGLAWLIMQVAGSAVVVIDICLRRAKLVPRADGTPDQ